MPCFLTNQKKENNQFENKEQPKLPEKHLNRSPTAKELKKYSTRSRRGADRQQGGEARATGGPHRQSRIGVQISLGESWGARWTLKPWVSVQANKDSKPQFEEKICGDFGSRRNT